MFQSSKLLTLSIVSFLVALPCGAAIAFDTVTDGGNNGGTTHSLTWSHTATGSNILLVVCLAGDNVNTGHDDITSVTSGGSSLTLAAKYTGGGASSSNGFAYIYFLPNAPSGSHSIVVNSTNNHELIAVSATYTGTSVSQPDNTATFSNSSNPSFTTSITTHANNSWVLTCENAPKSGPSTTCIFRIQGAAFNLPSIYDTNGPVSPAGSSSCTTEANVIVANDNHVMMSIQPPSVGGCHVAPPNTITSYLDCVGAGTNCGHFIFSPLTGLPDCLGIGALCARVTLNPYTGLLDCAGS